MIDADFFVTMTSDYWAGAEIVRTPDWRPADHKVRPWEGLAFTAVRVTTFVQPNLAKENKSG